MTNKVTILTVFLFLWELVAAFRRKHLRKSVFNRALHRARTTGKKLLVIGDPSHGFFNKITGPDYGYGDECIDFTGCPNAPEGTIVHKDAVENVLPTLDLSEYVIFQSCVFEYVESFERVKSLLHHVPHEDLFFVQVSPWSIAAWLYVGFLVGDDSVPKRVFLRYPPFDSFTWPIKNPLAEWNKSILLVVFAICLWNFSNIIKSRHG
jgi:hypothetical protein